MLLDAWRLAVGTLTAVPVKAPSIVDRRRAAVAMILAPLAVLPLGAAVVVVALAGHWLGMPLLLTSLLAVGAVVVGNRALHYDGLSDTVDGLTASYDPERSLTVMKTGTSGPAGVLAVVLVLGLQVVGLAAVMGLPHWWRAAVLGGVVVCVSRAALVVCCSRGVLPAREDGLGRAYTQTVPVAVAAASWVGAACVVAAVGWWAGLAWWRGALAVALALGVVVVLVVRAVRRFGGVTGDVFGASIELSLASLLVGLS